MEDNKDCKIDIDQIQKVKAKETVKTKQQNEDDEETNFDELLKKLGMGCWQIKYMVTIGFIQAFAPASMISSSFTNMPLDFRCDSTYNTYKNYNSTNENIYDNQCIDKNYLEEEIAINIFNLSDTSKFVCNQYEYDKTKFISTVSSEFDLVCDNAWLSPLFQTALMIGLTFGSLFIGLGDKWGRLFVLRVAVYISLAGVLLVGLSPNYYLILLGRGLIGFCYPLMNVPAYALTMESVPPNFRTVVGGLVMIPYFVSVMAVGGLSSIIRKWRILHFILSIYIFLLAAVVFVIDESPMWLAQQGRIDEALIGLQNAAKLNKKKLPGKKQMIKYMRHRRISIFGSTVLTNNLNHSTFGSIKDTFQSLFGTQPMRIITITTPLIWLFTGIVVIGVPLNANNFTDNPYLYMVLLGACEMVPSIFGSILLKKFGNIFTGVLMHIGTGICLILILILGKRLIILQWVLVMVSRLFTGLNFVICYLLGSELFPTVVRAKGYGFCVFSMYFGFIISSYINDTIAGDVWWVFNSVCGLCSFMAAGLLLLLPETQGQSLCETVQDVNDRSKKKTSKCTMPCK